MSDGTVSSKHEWLVMLFLAGDNDIFKFGEILLEEAKRIGSTDSVAVIAEQDPTTPREPTKRGQLLNGTWMTQEIGETGGDPETIIDFVHHAKKLFPADKRMLILWDHGNGWQNVHVFGPITRATKTLRLEDIFTSDRDEDKIHLLCFDSCLMAMIEIAYELRGKVEYIVASENVVPADTGWPYASILGALTQRPRITPGQVACAIVDGFAGSYNHSLQQPVTLAALKLANVDAAVTAIDGLARQLLAVCFNGGGKQKVMFARRYAQSFGNPDYVDIISFCDELSRQDLGEGVTIAAENVRQKVGELILAPVRGSTLSVNGAHGLSIYFPDRPMSVFYQELEFAKPERCMWSTFIALLAPPMPPDALMPPRRRRAKGKESPRPHDMSDDAQHGGDQQDRTHDVGQPPHGYVNRSRTSDDQTQHDPGAP